MEQRTFEDELFQLDPEKSHAYFNYGLLMDGEKRRYYIDHGIKLHPTYHSWGGSWTGGGCLDLKELLRSFRGWREELPWLREHGMTNIKVGRLPDRDIAAEKREREMRFPELGFSPGNQQSLPLERR